MELGLADRSNSEVNFFLCFLYFILFYFLTLQYCIGFAKYQHEVDFFLQVLGKRTYVDQRLGSREHPVSQITVGETLLVFIKVNHIKVNTYLWSKYLFRGDHC